MWDRFKISRKVGWKQLKRLHEQMIINVNFKKKSVGLLW